MHYHFTKVSMLQPTMETQQVLLLLHAAGHLHDGDGEAVGWHREHGRGQWHVVLIQELCRQDLS